ncbi:MAG: hypothetical protein V4618_04820 [Pseudomonadota bacterium]
MNVVKELAGFLRWRLIPVRYAGKIARSLPGRAPKPLPPRDPSVARLRQTGWVPAPVIPAEVLGRIRDKYLPRADAVVAKKGGHPFTSLFHGMDIGPDDPICQLAFSRELLDTVHDYFGGRFRYNSIQIAYSWPTEGPLHQSQLWHRDYGDTRSFHWVAYLNDVPDDEGGPFTFVDVKATRRIGTSAIIRRIDDERFRRELGDGEIHRFLGEAGEGIFVDPSLCYHFGSRCRRPRFAMFVTFSTDTPFTAATDMVERDREKLIETACVLRPDLSPDYVRAILTV